MNIFNVQPTPNPLDAIRTLTKPNTNYIKKMPPEGTYMNPSPMYTPITAAMFTDKGKVLDIQRMYELNATSMEPEFNQVRRLWQMALGIQWTEAETERLRKMGRVARVLNFIFPQIIAYDATAARNQKKLKAYPRYPGGIDRANAHTELLNFNLDSCRYYEKKRKILTDGLIGRRGVGVMYWQQTSRFPDGEMGYDRGNPYDFIFDVDNSDLDINKGRFVYCRRFMTVDRIIQLWAQDNPEFADYLDRRAMMFEGQQARDRRKRSHSQKYAEMSSQNWTRDKHSGLGRASSESFVDTSMPTSMYFDSRRGMYLVIEYHEKKLVPRQFFYVPGNEEIPFSDELVKDGTLSKIQEMFPEGSVRTKYVPEYWVTVVSPILCPDVVLCETPYTVQSVLDDLGFSIRFLQPFNYALNRGQNIGLVDGLSDPQRAANRMKSMYEDFGTKVMNPDRIIDKNTVGDEDLDSWIDNNPGVVRKFRSTLQGMAPQIVQPNMAI